MTTLIFYACVVLLTAAARAFGTTYEMVNVVFFCVTWPLFTLAETIAIVVVVRRLRQARAQLAALDGQHADPERALWRTALGWTWRIGFATAAALTFATAGVAYAQFGRVDGSVLDLCTNRVRRDALGGAFHGPGAYDEMWGAYGAMKACVRKRRLIDAAESPAARGAR